MTPTTTQRAGGTSPLQKGPYGPQKVSPLLGRVRSGFEPQTDRLIPQTNPRVASFSCHPGLLADAEVPRPRQVPVRLTSERLSCGVPSLIPHCRQARCRTSTVRSSAPVRPSRSFSLREGPIVTVPGGVPHVR